MPRSYAIHRPVENTYLVRERDRRFVRELLGVVAAVVVLGGGLLAYTWVHIEILRTGYRIDDLEKRLHQLQEEERRWLLKTASLTHPEVVARRARQELGMQAPSLDQTLFYAELVAAAPERANEEGGIP